MSRLHLPAKGPTRRELGRALTAALDREDRHVADQRRVAAAAARLEADGDLCAGVILRGEGAAWLVTECRPAGPGRRVLVVEQVA